MSWIDRLLLWFLDRRGYVAVRKYRPLSESLSSLDRIPEFDHSRYKC